MAANRSAGILLHPTSLPGPHGIGDLGEAAYRWVDFLTSAGQTLWQLMPLGPTGYGDSPYQSFSAFAGNPYLVSLERLVEEGLLEAGDLESAPAFSRERVDYGAVIPFKLEVLSRSFERFEAGAKEEQRRSFERFCDRQAGWLDDYALFMAVKEAHGGKAWNEWEKDIRTRDPEALERWRERLGREMRRQKYLQWLFYEQWCALKTYANAREIRIIGDIPIFIAYDSADAWANPELFYFDDEGNLTVVAGVPPDYFSATGQRWGNPLYRWKRMKENRYAWWVARIKSTLEFFDLVRIDHFRGFEAYWEIPASEPTAVKGRWVKGPSQDFFDAVKAALGELPIIAEDLGIITPAVERLRETNGLPGMKVLQFAFAGPSTDPYLPHNYTENFIVYTGTHDNDTTRGWYETAPEGERDLVRRYLGRGDRDIVWHLVRLAYASVANMAVVPLQDVLQLGSEARMNFPGQAMGNWSWRFKPEQLDPRLAAALHEITRLYGRLPHEEVVDTPYRQSVTTTQVEEES
jgi:4-alpha-glucanotransferase